MAVPASDATQDKHSSRLAQRPNSNDNTDKDEASSPSRSSVSGKHRLCCLASSARTHGTLLHVPVCHVQRCASRIPECAGGHRHALNRHNNERGSGAHHTRTQLASLQHLCSCPCSPFHSLAEHNKLMLVALLPASRSLGCMALRQICLQTCARRKFVNSLRAN